MRLRLLIVLVGIVALVLAVHDIPLAGHLRTVERDRVNTKLERDGFIIAGRFEEVLEQGVARTDASLATMVAEYSVEEEVRVIVVDRSGIVVATSEGSVGDSFFSRPEIQSALSGEPRTGERESVTLGEDLFYVAVPALSGDEIVGAVRLSAPERVVNDRAQSKVNLLYVLAGISLLIAVVAALLLARTVTRGLGRLRAATHTLASGDLAGRADIADGPPEIRDLAESFNRMADQIEQLVGRQREFAGTASHQLRTPLTAIRLRLDQIATESNDATAVYVDEAIAETDRLHRVIEGLLTLSRAELDDLTPIEVNASDAIADRVDFWSPLAEESGCEIVADVGSDLMVRAVPGGIEQMIDNFIDNALGVSPTGSTIRITTERVDDFVSIHVVDQGAGLTEHERTAAFDRFWRGAGAAPGGTGLGLAIVAQLTTASGGSAELRAAPSGGVDAVVTLPAV
jgi:signal transduction histidine kinase